MTSTNPYIGISFVCTDQTCQADPTNTSFIWVATSCYNEGTKILCLINEKEEYKNIEELIKGDLVKTVNDGYKKIDLIGKNVFYNNPKSCFHCMYKVSNDDNELYVTGEHMILVKDLENIIINDENKYFYSLNITVDDYKCALAADVGEKILNNNKYTIYHFVLESEDDNKQYGIYANGILSESTTKNNFINNHFKLLK